MLGTSIAQAIPFAVMPILTRYFFTPEDFGTLALFLAISSILASMANARYDLAIILPKKDEDALGILSLGFLINSIFSIIILIIILLFKDAFLHTLADDSIGYYLYFIPLAVFISGVYSALSMYNNRIESYKNMAHAAILKSIVLASIQIIGGVLSMGVGALISGQLISQFVNNLKLFSKVTITPKFITKEYLFSLAKRYSSFPKFSLPGVLANSLTHHLIKILIPSLFSISTLGFYDIALRVLGIPSTIIGDSIGKVYLQEATIEKQKKGNSLKPFISTFKKLFWIGLPIFTISYFFSDFLFSFIFGEKWRIAGIYAGILSPLLFIRFISSTLSGTLTIYEKQKSELFINLLLISGSIGIIWVFDDFLSFIKTLVIVLSVLYSTFIVYYYHLSKGSK